MYEIIYKYIGESLFTQADGGLEFASPGLQLSFISDLGPYSVTLLVWIQVSCPALVPINVGSVLKCL